MSSNQIVNAIHAMVTFQAAATTNTIVPFAMVGVDEAFPGSNHGVERVGAGMFKVHLLTPLNPASVGPNAVVSGVSPGGTPCIIQALIDGADLDITLTTLAGAPLDVASVQLLVTRFPSGI